MALTLTAAGISKGYTLVLLRQAAPYPGTPGITQYYWNGVCIPGGGAIFGAQTQTFPIFVYSHDGLITYTDLTPGQSGNVTMNPDVNNQPFPNSTPGTPVQVAGRYFTALNNTNPGTIREIDVNGNTVATYANPFGATLYNPIALPDETGFYIFNSGTNAYKFTLATNALTLQFSGVSVPYGDIPLCLNIRATDSDEYCFFTRGPSSPQVFQLRRYSDWSLVASYNVPFFPCRSPVFCGGTLGTKFLFMAYSPATAITRGIYEFDYGTSTLTMIAADSDQPISLIPLTSTQALVGTGQALYLLTVPAGGIIYGGVPDVPPPPEPPDAPEGLTGPSGCTGCETVLTWMGAALADGYRAYWRYPNGLWQRFYGGVETTATHAPVLIGTTYEYAVTAYNDDGESGYSNVITVTPCCVQYAQIDRCDTDYSEIDGCATVYASEDCCG